MKEQLKNSRFWPSLILPGELHALDIKVGFSRSDLFVIFQTLREVIRYTFNIMKLHSDIEYHFFRLFRGVGSQCIGIKGVSYFEL